MRLEYSHTGGELSDWYRRILQQFITGAHLAVATTDNASNMKACITTLGMLHMPCFGHLANLAVKSVFRRPKKQETPARPAAAGSAASSSVESPAQDPELEDDDEDPALDGRFPAVDQLRMFLAFVGRASNVSDELERCVDQNRAAVHEQCHLMFEDHNEKKELPRKLLDLAPTRWSSMYQALQRVLMLWPALEVLVTTYAFSTSWARSHANKQHPITPENKPILASIWNALQPVDTMIREVQGRTITTADAIASVFSCFNSLLQDSANEALSPTHKAAAQALSFSLRNRYFGANSHLNRQQVVSPRLLPVAGVSTSTSVVTPNRVRAPIKTAMHWVAMALLLSPSHWHGAFVDKEEEKANDPPAFELKAPVGPMIFQLLDDLKVRGYLTQAQGRC